MQRPVGSPPTMPAGLVADEIGLERLDVSVTIGPLVSGAVMGPRGHAFCLA